MRRCTLSYQNAIHLHSLNGLSSTNCSDKLGPVLAIWPYTPTGPRIFLQGTFRSCAHPQPNTYNIRDLHRNRSNVACSGDEMSSTEVEQPHVANGAEATNANAPNASPAKKQPKRNSPKYAPSASMMKLVEAKRGEDALGFKLEVTDGKVPFAKNVVATRNFEQGELISVERPCLTQVASMASGMACHACLTALDRSERPTGDHNPAQPVYCGKCKKDGKVEESLEESLLPLRAKMPDMAKDLGVDVVLLSIVANLEFARNGVRIPLPTPEEEEEKKDRTFQSTIEDWDSITSVWDRKPEAWRKKVGPALRALHKELVALAASGGVAGYSKASPLPRMQCDAALIDLVLQPAYHNGITPLTNQETYAFGFYPGLLMYQQGCAPNAHFAVSGSELMVRAIVPIEKGQAIVVSHIPLTMARDQRQTVLEQQRFISCACDRCKHPMKDSVDRLIDGVVCMDCLSDVLLPCEEGAENDEACEAYKARLDSERQSMLKVLQKKLRSAKSDASKERIEKEIALYSDVMEVPEGVLFWRCQACGGVEPSHTTDGTGPSDVLAKARTDFHQACIHKMLSESQVGTKDAEGKDKTPEEIRQKLEEHKKHRSLAMELLEPLCRAMDGRLPPYHCYVMESLPLLISLLQRENEHVKVLTFGIQKWDTERQLVEDRPTKSQLQILKDILNAAQATAEKTRSENIKKQFSKKVKQAEDQVDNTTEALYGKKLADTVREHRKRYKAELRKSLEAQQERVYQERAAAAAAATAPDQ